MAVKNISETTMKLFLKRAERIMDEYNQNRVHSGCLDDARFWIDTAYQT